MAGRDRTLAVTKHLVDLLFPQPHIRGAGSAGRRQRLGLEHRIGYAYGMNYFDAAKCSADPRSVVPPTRSTPLWA